MRVIRSRTILDPDSEFTSVGKKRSRTPAHTPLSEAIDSGPVRKLCQQIWTRTTEAARNGRLFCVLRVWANSLPFLLVSLLSAHA